MEGDFDPKTGAYGVAVPRRLESQTGRLNAEWHLLLADLEQYREIASRSFGLVESLELEQSDKVWLKRSVFQDLVVQFIAFFDKDSLARLDPEVLYSDIDGALDSFRYIESIRNTSIAHRHGASRQAATAVYLDEDTGRTLGIGAVLSGISWKIDPGVFVALIDVAARYARSQIEPLGEAVSAELGSMHPSQRLRLPLAMVKVPDERTMRLGRRKFSNVNRMNRNEAQVPEVINSPDDLAHEEGESP